MNQNIRVCFLSFVITFVLLFPIAVIVLTQIPTAKQTPAKAVDAQPEYQVSKEQDLTFLLTVSPKMADPADVFVLMKISTHDNSVCVCSFSKDIVAVSGSKTATLSDLFAWGGIDAAKKAVENLTFIDIDRTLRIDDEGITDIVNQIGGVETTLEQPMEYDGMQLQSGWQFLDGTRFCVMLKNDPVYAIETLGSCFTSKLNLSALFTMVSEKSQIDLSAYDLALRKSSWEQMMKTHNARFKTPLVKTEQINQRQRLTQQSRRECQEVFGS